MGSSFDAIALNLSLCEQYKVPVIGVILNRVIPEKRSMVLKYMKIALKRWSLPILGSIPFDPFLSNPSMRDFEFLFKTTLLSGEEHRLRHFDKTRLVATSIEIYQDLIAPKQLIITPANREDIILATLTRHWEVRAGSPGKDLEAGMLLTGATPPSPEILEQLKLASIPMLYAPVSSYHAMQQITSYTAKIGTEDLEKVREAIALVENHVDFDRLEALLT